MTAIRHRVSAYAVSRSELPAAAAFGLTVDLVPSRSLDDSYRAELRGLSLPYIDLSLWRIIQSYVPPTCRSTVAPCNLTAANEARLLEEVKAHLTALKGDDQLVAFYVLDDYPGNIAPILRRIHSLVVAANATSAWARPTICAFDAPLDYQDATGAWHRGRGTFNSAALNFAPDACDVVSLYAYSPDGQAAASVDWSMGQVLPDAMRILATRGRTTQPLIGTPMAFSYPAKPWIGPTADQLRAQTTAFCDAGAVALMPYAWDDGYSQPKAQLSNSTALRQGFLAGVTACRASWGRG